MKIIFILLLWSTFSFSQSISLEEFISFEKPIDSSSVIKNFNNGNIKEKYNLYLYNVGDFIYEIPYGKACKYYKNGNLLSKIEYDNFGNPLSEIFYFECGEVFIERKLIKIEVNTSSLEQFFNDYKSVTYVFNEKEYDYSNKSCNYYLKKEGFRLNHKKIKIWKYYNEDGTLKRTKNFN